MCTNNISYFKQRAKFNVILLYVRDRADPSKRELIALRFQSQKFEKKNVFIDLSLDF